MSDPKLCHFRFVAFLSIAIVGSRYYVGFIRVKFYFISYAKSVQHRFSGIRVLFYAALHRLFIAVLPSLLQL